MHYIVAMAREQWGEMEGCEIGHRQRGANSVIMSETGIDRDPLTLIWQSDFLLPRRQTARSKFCGTRLEGSLQSIIQCFVKSERKEILGEREEKV
jgi:hypothetical protein